MPVASYVIGSDIISISPIPTDWASCVFLPFLLQGPMNPEESTVVTARLTTAGAMQRERVSIKDKDFPTERWQRPRPKQEASGLPWWVVGLSEAEGCRKGKRTKCSLLVIAWALQLLCMAGPRPLGARNSVR